MPRLEKWLTDVGPDAPVSRAARKALAVRFKAAEHYLRQAAQFTGKSADDAEAVHQLRIWTRRAAAALRLFSEVLPRRTAKWLKRKLRKVRRTAGEARDCDVLTERLERGDLPGLAPAAMHLRARRRRAEKQLAKDFKSLVKSGKLDRKAQKLLKKVRDRGQAKLSITETFGSWCRQQLGPLVADLMERGNADLSRDANLHQLRLAGKRLRYALELAPAALPAATHRRLYNELTDLQDRLGTVCDLIVAAGRMKTWLANARQVEVLAELKSALKRHERQLASAKVRFLRWWSPKRRAALRRSWVRALRGDRG